MVPFDWSPPCPWNPNASASAKATCTAAADRELVLAKILGSMGTGVHFEPTFRCEFGYNISVGSNFYANFDCNLLDGADITIGDNVLFGPRVSIYTSNHALDAHECAARLPGARGAGEGPAEDNRRRPLRLPAGVSL